LLVSVGTHLGQVHPGALMVTLVTLGVALLVRRLDKRKPYMLLGLVAGSAAAAAFNAWAAGNGGTPVSVVGAIAQPWPPFHIPSVDWRALPDLLSLAFALTIVALAQSISIAKAVATRSGQRIDANREFVGQGLSNIVGGFFSCYLSCGSLNRSIPNYEAGAKTPLAAVFSAVLLVVLVAVSAPLLAMIPNAAISGLLLLVAWTLLDIPRWRELIRMQPGESAIAAATLAATVTIRMEVAILLGTVLSLMAYLHRTSRPAMRTMGFDSRGLDRRFVVLEHQPDALPECPQLKLLRMEGSIYFGAAAHVAQRLHELREAPNAPRHLLVMAKSMNFIDLAGAQVWEDELAARRAMGGDLYFHRPRPEVLDMWRRTGFLTRLGEDHIYPDKATALHAIYAKLDRDICAGCQAKIFWECQPDSPQGGH